MEPHANCYDVIVIGGGHNGLVTAALLAKQGRRVILLERRHQLGGCLRRGFGRPGFERIRGLLSERGGREGERLQGEESSPREGGSESKHRRVVPPCV